MISKVELQTLKAKMDKLLVAKDRLADAHQELAKEYKEYGAFVEGLFKKEEEGK